MSVVRCLLIPLAEYNLLIPNVVVSEILNYVEPDLITQTEATATPEWLLGNISWRGDVLHLISSELLSGALLPLPKITQCIAVLRLPQLEGQFSCVALLSQRLPRLITVTPQAIQLANSSPPAPCLAGLWVQVNDEFALIPDLDSLQNQLNKATLLPSD